MNKLILVVLGLGFLAWLVSGLPIPQFAPANPAPVAQAQGPSHSRASTQDEDTLCGKVLVKIGASKLFDCMAFLIDGVPDAEIQAALNAAASGATAAQTPPATSVPPLAASTPAPASVQVSGTTPPTGWEEVDSTLKAGMYNHDNDGHENRVFLTWDNVALVSPDGKKLDDFGVCSLRVTVDPNGERLSTSGGWRQFEWITGGKPGQDKVEGLVNWWKAVLEGQGGACTQYTVSWQTSVSMPHPPASAAQPPEWKEVKDPSYTGGKQVFKDNYDLGGPSRAALAWFWSGPGPAAPVGPDGCTLYVMTGNGPVTYQGGLRVFGLTGGTVNKINLAALVPYWKGVLEKEPNDVACGHTGAYRLIYQDTNMAP